MRSRLHTLFLRGGTALIWFGRALIALIVLLFIAISFNWISLDAPPDRIRVTVSWISRRRPNVVRYRLVRSSDELMAGLTTDVFPDSFERKDGEPVTLFYRPATRFREMRFSEAWILFDVECTGEQTQWRTAVPLTEELFKTQRIYVFNPCDDAAAPADRVKWLRKPAPLPSG